MRPIPIGDLPQEIIDKMRPEDRADLGLKSSVEEMEEIDAKRRKNDEVAEKKIQSEVESYLVHLGYKRRSPDGILGGTPESGWFIHLHETKRNPILLDLLILSNAADRRYLEVELKTATGKVRDEQAALVAQGATLCRSSEEAVAVIKKWHEEVNA